jgi:general secretion pathway protein J
MTARGTYSFEKDRLRLETPANSAPKPGRRSTGFTLLEILIATAIFALVLVAINGVFYAAMRLRARASRAIEDLTPVEHAISIMKRDILAAVPPASSNLLTGPMTTTPSVMVAVSQPGSALEFYTSSALIADDVPWGDVQRVDYYLKQPVVRTTGTGQDLVRSVTRNLLAQVQEQPEEQVILEDVQQLRFEFYDGGQWRQSWDATTVVTTGTNQSAMPLAVQISIQLAEAEGKVRLPIQFLVPITTQVISNSASATNSI